MNALWSYFWPLFAGGLLIGAICGSIAFRRRKSFALLIGAVLTVAAAGLWSGPLGAADRLAQRVERDARATLVNNEIPEVTSQLQRGPLTRRLLLSGPANDFQRRELVRIMNQIPGVASAGWDGKRSGVPLIGESAAVAILGFLLGLLVAYLVELRRRYNLQWNW
jgi:membrane associated rhomboid family serine protease